MASASARKGHWRETHGTALCLAAVVVAALLLRLTPVPSWPSSDSANYVAVAWSYLAQDPAVPALYAGPPHDPRLDSGPMAFSIRQGLTWPLAVPIKLLGFSPGSFCLVPIAFGLVEVLLAFFVGRKVAGTRAGLLAAAIIATLPWSVGESRYARADQVSATLAYLGVYVAAFSALSGRHWLLSAVTGGALLAWAWFTKETTAFLYIALATAALFSGGLAKGNRSRFIAVAATLLVALALECAAYYGATGDPLHRFHAMEVNQEQCKANFFTAESADHGWRDTTYSRALLNRLLLTGPRALLLGPAGLGLVFAGTLCAAAMIWSRARARTEPYLKATCCLLLSLLLIYNFATTSLSEYRPIPDIYVYFYPLVLPSAVIVAAAVIRLAPRFRHPYTARACIAMILAISASASVARNFRNDLGPRFLDSLMARLDGGSRVMTDPQTAWELSQRFANSPLPSHRVVAWGSDPDASKAEYVLIRPVLVRFLRDRYRFDGPPLDELLKGAELVERHAVFELWRLPDKGT